MNRDEAKDLLAGWRPGSARPMDRLEEEALRFAEADPELQRWLAQRETMHSSLAAAFGQIRVPNDLAERILLDRRRIPSPIPKWRQWMPAAAAVACIVLLAWVSFPWLAGPRDNSLETLRSRVVRSVLREYSMDVVTNDMAAIRRYLASHQAPADYSLPTRLSQFKPTGAGCLSWQGGKASMVCLDSGPDGLVYVFVVHQSSLHKPPPGSAPVFAPINRLITASWTDGRHAYVLAATVDRVRLSTWFE